MKGGGRQVRKRILRIISLLLISAFCISLISGCAGAMCVGELTITDAGGAGTRISYIYSPVANSEYIDVGPSQATFLTEYLISALGETDAAIYKIKYVGVVKKDDAKLVNSFYELSDEEKNLGYHLFSLEYSFSDIKDYNRKTSKLYNLSKNLALDNSDDNYRVGMLDDYVDTVLRITDDADSNGITEEHSTVTLTETGAISYGVVAWAFIALYRSRHDEGMWKNNEVYFAPFSNDETHTIFSALKTQLTVCVGDTVRTVTPLTGSVIEGQGFAEGITFNVTGSLQNAEEPFPVSYVVIICAAGLLLVSAAAFIIFLIIKKRRT